MQILSLLEPIDDYSNATAGFRLQRFEVLNWGTFNERIWVINLDGKTALLTGANGSGKSTLVDALLTLMVPNKSRNYNKASSASNKKERDEKSYVQGAYSRTRSEESYGSKPKFLRVKKEPSILLAYFNNCVTKKDVTLAQVLWIENGSVQKLFILADMELTIQNNFGLFKNIEELKKQLQTDKVECFKEFSKYSQQFRKRFGLQSPKALDLFNQIVSVKEIGSLNEFVRSQMLEKTDTQNNIRDLQKSFEDLTVCQAKIESASNQLNTLIPIVEESEKYKNIHSEITNLEKYLSFLPAFFAREKNNLLENRLKNIEQSLMQTKDKIGECDNQLETLDQKKKDLELDIHQDANGLRLRELTNEIDQSQKEISRKKKEAEYYDQLAQQLELPVYADSDIFYSARTKGEELKENIEAILKELDEKKDGKKEKRRELQKQKIELDSELQSLRSRKSQIPENNLKIRNRLVADLSLNENDLPFVGELLRVRPEAKEWEGVIERLLSSFGLYILVPEVHYQSTNAYIRKTNLRGRLTYFRVQPIPTSVTQRASDPKRIPHKLEIKPENQMFSEWLQSRLAKQYNYLCCETIEQFQHETRAVTREGLIKHDTERHEKNDTYSIDDSRRYILGWDNSSKIEAFENELTNINQDLNDVEGEIKILESKERQSNQQERWLHDFMRFTDFSEIDWHTKEKDMVKLQQEKNS